MSNAGLVYLSSHALARLLGQWRSGPGPAHRRLSDLVRLLILDGRLPLATIMPGERDLAEVLGISRTTVSTAYATLREQGYLESRDRTRSQTRLPAAKAQPSEVGGPDNSDVIDFSVAASAAPGVALHRAYSEALNQLPRHLPHHGYASLGWADLRLAVARRYADRGLPTTPDQILVTNGAQHAFSLLVRTLLRPRDRVVVDHPTYPHALLVLRTRGCRILPVPLTDHGWDLAELTARSRGAAMAYLLPDFHNPTGLCLSDRVRHRLRMRCPVVVDETMAELALDGAPPTALAAPHEGVISIGSAAKVFWGGLRIGWIRASPDLVQQLAQARAGTDLGTPVLEQLACAELLRNLDDVLPSRLDELRHRRSVLRQLVAEHLPDWTVGESHGGLSVWARLPQPVSSALAAVAPEHGVRLAAGPRFGVGGAFERFVRLPYSLDPSTLAAGIDRIAHAVRAVRPGPAAIIPATDLA